MSQVSHLSCVACCRFARVVVLLVDVALRALSSSIVNVAMTLCSLVNTAYTTCSDVEHGHNIVAITSAQSRCSMLC
jgi:hypothetical protein